VFCFIVTRAMARGCDVSTLERRQGDWGLLGAAAEQVDPRPTTPDWVKAVCLPSLIGVASRRKWFFVWNNFMRRKSLNFINFYHHWNNTSCKLYFLLYLLQSLFHTLAGINFLLDWNKINTYQKIQYIKWRKHFFFSLHLADKNRVFMICNSYTSI
jgi:hypothetical protein